MLKQMKQIGAVPLLFLFSLVLTGCTYSESNYIIAKEVFSEIYYTNETGTALVFSEPDVYYPVFFTDDGLTKGIDYNIGFNELSNMTIIYPGIYEAYFSLVGTGINNHEYHAAVFVNEIEQEKCETKLKRPATGDISFMSSRCFLNLSTSDVLSVRISDKYSTGTGYYYNGNFQLERVYK
jgi:hypothetical protein